MKKQALQIRRFGEARAGYRVLTSRKKPPLRVSKNFFDVWIPQLSPSVGLWKNYQQRSISWPKFKNVYFRELNSIKSQNLLKPLALLSFRNPVVLLCDCEDHWRCPTAVLAEAIDVRRKSGDFVLNFSGDDCHESRH